MYLYGIECMVLFARIKMQQGVSVPSLYPLRDEDPRGDTCETSGKAGLNLESSCSLFNL